MEAEEGPSQAQRAPAASSRRRPGHNRTSESPGQLALGPAATADIEVGRCGPHSQSPTTTDRDVVAVETRPGSGATTQTCPSSCGRSARNGATRRTCLSSCSAQPASRFQPDVVPSLGELEHSKLGTGSGWKRDRPGIRPTEAPGATSRRRRRTRRTTSAPGRLAGEPGPGPHPGTAPPGPDPTAPDAATADG